MSASACVAYVGIRYEIAEQEIELLESRNDPRQRAAKQAGLSSYWGNFGGSDERYLLFVGEEIAVLGVENLPRISVTSRQLADISESTEVALAKVHLSGDFALHLEWLKDS